MTGGSSSLSACRRRTRRAFTRTRSSACGSRSSCPTAEVAALDVVVHQAHRLHERIDRRRSDKGPPAPAEILAQRDRLRCGRHAHQSLSRDPPRPRRRIRFPPPEVVRQRPAFLPQLDRALGVIDRRFDLAAMTNDPFVAEQSRDVARREAGDAIDVEVHERAPEVLALPEDRQPAQTGLEAFEADLLEQTAVVFDRLPPLAIVILDVERIGPAPPAAVHLWLGRSHHLKMPRMLLPIAPKSP